MPLTVVRAVGELLEQWREVHNRVIAPNQLTHEAVTDSARRNDLTLAFVDEHVVGNATVRAPDHDEVTVIVRILPEYRRRGIGSQYLEILLQRLGSDDVATIKTVVVAANTDGVTFAIRHSFVETARYEIDGAEFIDLVRHNPPVRNVDTELTKR